MHSKDTQQGVLIQRGKPTSKRTKPWVDVNQQQLMDTVHKVVSYVTDISLSRNQSNHKAEAIEFNPVKWSL